MEHIYDRCQRGIAAASFAVLYGLRMAIWFILTVLRRPIQFALGLGTFAGWIAA